MDYIRIKNWILLPDLSSGESNYIMNDFKILGKNL